MLGWALRGIEVLFNETFRFHDIRKSSSMRLLYDQELRVYDEGLIQRDF